MDGAAIQRSRRHALSRLLACLAAVALVPANAAAQGFPFPLRDIQPEVMETSSKPREFVSVGETTFFFASTRATGNEQWKTDGSAAGTVVVKEIEAGNSAFAEHHSLTAVNGMVFFTAVERVHGQELWKSDGTAEGTVLVKDICPGSCPRDIPQAPMQLTAVGGRAFFNADDGVHGRELWRSDWTMASTKLVKDIRPGASSAVPDGLTNLRAALFAADDAVHGRELWRSDGTPAGTRLLKDIMPGPESSSPQSLVNINGILVFRACDAQGCEPWISDGTTAGTRRRADVFPGALSSDPELFTHSGPWVYFAAYDDATGHAPAGAESLEILLGGLAPDAADLGDPVSGGTRYDLCLYDGARQQVAELTVDRAGQSCGAKACWRAIPGQGYRYLDPKGSSDGIRSFLARIGGETAVCSSCAAGTAPPRGRPSSRRAWSRSSRHPTTRSRCSCAATTRAASRRPSATSSERPPSS